MSESAFAQHILTSIRNELNLLKSQSYIQPYAYDEILKLLPSNASDRNTTSIGGVYPPVTNNNAFSGAMPSPVSNNNISSGIPPPPAYNATLNDSKKLGDAEALYDYNGENPNTDLSFRRGDIIQLTELVNDDWWKGSLYGKIGIFPRTYVKRLQNTREKMSSPPPPPSRQQRDSYGYASSALPKQDAYNSPPPQNTVYAAPPNTYSAPPLHNSYGPPPMNSSYAPPPPQQNSYQPPPPQQMAPYSAPPPLASTSSAPTVVEQSGSESKVAGFGKKVAGRVGEAAAWGFGATLGSDVAHSIF